VPHIATRTSAKVAVSEGFRANGEEKDGQKNAAEKKVMDGR
jgi:hypothetical protein